MERHGKRKTPYYGRTTGSRSYIWYLKFLDRKEEGRGILKKKMADALEMDQKTISRIERGKYKPKPETFQKIQEYLAIDRSFCSTRIVTEDFALLEQEWNIAKLNSFGREEEARVLYLSLKNMLSDEWKENRQYKKFMDTHFANQEGEYATI